MISIFPTYRYINWRVSFTDGNTLLLPEGILFIRQITVRYKCKLHLNLIGCDKRCTLLFLSFTIDFLVRHFYFFMVDTADWSLAEPAPVPGSGFSVPRPSFSVPGFWFPVARSQFPVSGSSFPVHRSPFTVPRFSFSVSLSPSPVQFSVPRSVLRSPFPFPVLRFSSPFPVSRSPFPLPRSRF